MGGCGECGGVGGGLEEEHSKNSALTVLISSTAGMRTKWKESDYFLFLWLGQSSDLHFSPDKMVKLGQNSKASWTLDGNAIIHCLIGPARPEPDGSTGLIGPTFG